MSYATLTRHDSNPLKRYLQRRRLRDALSLISGSGERRMILDYGAGDGETCRQLSACFPQATIVCYEPCEELREEAKGHLCGLDNLEIAGCWDDLPQGKCDLVLCMEVFEHLIPEQIEQELARIESLLQPNGQALVGVPLEIFGPALFKGAFRMTRRFGEFDARPMNILKAALGRPPQKRPLGEIAPGLPYHFHHLGFDHRRLQRQIEARFHIEQVVGSPLPWIGPLLNSEIYFLLSQRNNSSRA